MSANTTCCGLPLCDTYPCALTPKWQALKAAVGSYGEQASRPCFGWQFIYLTFVRPRASPYCHMAASFPPLMSSVSYLSCHIPPTSAIRTPITRLTMSSRDHYPHVFFPCLLMTRSILTVSPAPYIFIQHSSNYNVCTSAPSLPVPLTRFLLFLLLRCTSLHFTALHCTSLHYTALHCTSLHFTALPMCV